MYAKIFLIYFVSIHAPTRGATKVAKALRGMRKVSIHAPTRGATIIDTNDFGFLLRFNPRTHTGCDVVLKVLPTRL